MEEKFFFNQQADFSEIVGDGKIIAFNISSNGEALLLIAAPQYEAISHGREQKGLAIFPLTRAKKSYPLTFFRFSGNRLLQKTEITDLEITFPMVQVLPNEQILLVGARCDFKNGNPDKNAVVFDKEGKVLHQFVMGDGINDVQTTDEGDIWVSYFDEGVFGNFGWTEPMGSAGLNCFDSKGQILWRFIPPQGFDSICDCYALNVTQNIAWACYYTDFPLVKINSDKQVEGWNNTIGGANALAINNDGVLLWGGYGNKRTRCVLQKFGDKTLIESREVSLSLPDGFDLAEAEVVGRGSALHTFTGNKWFVLEKMPEILMFS
jgi:hypothetical protein